MSFNSKNKHDKQKSENIREADQLMSDDFHIKSHLNTSLDLSGITVSEELITKTLAAIKKQEENPEESKEDSAEEQRTGVKKTALYRNIRIISGAVAAVIVLAVGLKYLSGSEGMFVNQSKNMDTATTEQESAADNAAAINPSCAPASSESGEAAAGTAGSVESQDNQQFDVTYGLTADAGLGNSDQTGASADSTDEDKLDGSSQTAGDSNGASSSGEDNSGDSENFRKDSEALATGVPGDQGEADGSAADMSQGLASMLTVNENLAFQDIVLAAPEEIGTLTITNNLKNKYVTITLPGDVQSFYDNMGQQQFTAGQQEPASVSYTIEAGGLDSKGALFTMTVGDTVMVTATSGGAASRSFYTPVDTDALLKVLAGYFK